MSFIRKRWQNNGNMIIGEDGEALIELVFKKLGKNPFVIEFGSGLSTDIILQHTNRFVSFDHDPVWKHPRALLRRLKNNFYDIKKEDITEKADMVIVDGPPGDFKGGRAKSVPYLVKHNLLNSPCYLIVDDVGREAEYKMATRWIKKYNITEISTCGRCALLIWRK